MAEVLLPGISGISARGWRDDRDWATIPRLINENLKSIGVSELVTTAEVKGWLANSDDIDQEHDYVFVDVESETVAYTLSPTYTEHDGRRIYRHNCRVHPAWQGKGIGKALLDWVIAYSSERSANLGSGTLQTDVVNDDPALTWLLVSAGYEAVQHSASLVRPDLEAIPDRRLPDGIDVRPVEKSHLRAIYESDHEAFKDHWGTGPQTEGDWKAFLEFAYRDESLWKVAWEDDRVVGQVRGYVNEAENEAFDRKRGYAEFISTAAEWRGKGIASALICETLLEFKKRDLQEAALGVHVENPTGAYRLYQNLGFEVVNTGTTYERSVG